MVMQDFLHTWINQIKYCAWFFCWFFLFFFGLIIFLNSSWPDEKTEQKKTQKIQVANLGFATGI